MHIAVCGELGAGCTEVGQVLSKKLGLKCVNSASIIRSMVADFRGVHPNESFQEFEQHVRSGEVDLDKMIDSKIGELLGQEDTIVEGRSAFMLLDNKDVFRILLVAPAAKRAHHIAQSRNITVDEAEEAIRVSDSERKQMVERLLKKEWLNPLNYDIVINTELRSYEETADLIVKAIPRRSIPQ